MTCILREKGRVVCWGRAQKREPQEIEGIDGVVELGTFVDGVIARTTAGFYLVEEGSKKPHVVDAPRTAVELVVGGGAVCARTPDGEVLCQSPTGGWQKIPLPRPAKKIVGGGRLVALLDDASLAAFLCPGRNPTERITKGCKLEPVAIDLPHAGIARVSGSRDGLCVVDASRHAHCELTASKMENLTCIDAATDVVEAEAGARHACARHRDGTVSCCGGNDVFQLGGTRSADGLAKVATIAHADALSVRGSHACVRDGADVRCWGDETSGVLGRGRAPRVFGDLPIEGARAIWAGWSTTCVRVEPTKLSCSGHPSGEFAFPSEVRDVSVNTDGIVAVLADGTVFTASDLGVTRALPTIDDADAVSGGNTQTCVHRKNKSAYCWGRDDAIIDATIGKYELRATSSLVEEASNGGCYVGLIGAVTCWGNQLEYGWSTANPRSPSLFVTVPRVRAVEIAVAQQISCARSASGQVQCWGPSLAGKGAPIAIGIDDAAAIAAGGLVNVCAIRKTGAVVCTSRELDPSSSAGNGSKETPGPKELPPLAGSTALAVGASHVCGLLPGGKVRCYGRNEEGQLGLPHDPVTVPLDAPDAASSPH